MEQNSSARLRTIWILVFIISFFGSISIFRYLDRPPKYHAKYRTIAHRFLDLQGKYVSIPDDSYKLLDDVITEAKSEARYDPTITDPAKREEQMLAIFQTIDSILIQKNFIFPPGEITSTLGEALEDHPLSASEMEAALAKPHNARRVLQMKHHADENFHLMACIPAAYLYMGVAEAIGFELKPVLVPEHVFVRAQLDKDHWINWDGNRGRSISDEEYVRDWGVEDWQIRKGIFMHPLSANEIDAHMYSSLGACLADDSISGGYDTAIECYRKAIALNPNDFYANCNLAGDLLFQPDPDSAVRAEAMALAQHAAAMQPDEGASELKLAYAFAANGQTAEAVAEINKIDKDDQVYSEAREMLPYIQSGYTMYGARKAQQPIMFWINHENGWLYILIFVIALMSSGLFFLVRRRMKARNAASKPPTISTVSALSTAA